MSYKARVFFIRYVYTIYIYVYRLVPGPRTTYDGVGGWGGMLTFMWTCRSSWCCAHAGVGWGGMGWDVNVHVNLQMMMILMLMMMMMMMWWWWWWWCDDDDDDDDDDVMMMMMMTLMKLVNSATKFRHGIDKFYQPNSGLRSSRTWDEAIYTQYYTHILSILWMRLQENGGIPKDRP